MKKAALTLVLLLVAAASFTAGLSSRQGADARASAGRQVLYYVDPMHPAYRSDRPGIAPDCGMQLEPVYADDAAAPGEEEGARLPVGVAKVSAEQQQLIGVRVADARRVASTHTVRVPGRVAVDERRLHRLTAATDGWIREIHGATTGSLVEDGAPLAAFYSPEFLAAEQAYLFALASMDRFERSGATASPEQLALTRANIQAAIDALTNLGMGRAQIEAIARTRQLTQDVTIQAPVRGFVLARNISPGQRFERGAELYRLADLSHVWVLADLLGPEARMVKPGVAARISLAHQGTALPARVSDVPPHFDASTRTLKLRLEAENPGFALRPDMFVDVELPVALPPAIVVPADAILDAGRTKTVFVDRGRGVFEPRHVVIGWRFGDRVEIVEGLAPGERIVISGTFLLDSESRMRLAAAGVQGTPVKDPVCDMTVDQAKATAAGRVTEYQGRTFYFCSEQCKRSFDAAPERYSGRAGGGKARTPGHEHHGHEHHGHD